MRSRLSLFLSALVVMLGVLSVAQPVAAAPAQPFSIDECSAPGALVFCYQAKGVVHHTVTPSGNVSYVDNREECSQVFHNGVVVQDVCQRQHYVVHAKDNQEHVMVSRAVSDQTYVLSGVTYTCSGSYNAVYANGEIRHDTYQFACTPPMV
jgi:hypothetical protein